MRDTVTITKVIVPRRRFNLLSRQRLLDLLENLLEYRLIHVAAPAGYGKTSLLIDLAHQVEYPVCWLALDSLDQSIYRFLVHFIAAIQYQFSDFGKNSFAVLQSAQQTDMNLDLLVTTIVNEIYEHISEHFALVLDDYHLVEESEEIKTFINRFAQEMDENCHLVIASRSLLNLLDLPLMVGRTQVKCLGSDELAFCPGEIKALLQRIYDQSISDEQAQNLANETEGWITGLLLSAEAMWKGMTDQVRVTRVTGVDVYDYLAQQVLDQQSQQVRDFLLRTSLLEEFNAQLCQSVLGQAPDGTSWSQLIEAVRHHNLFVQPVENGGTWLRYHHLFQNFLQKQLSKEQPQVEERILRRLLEECKDRLEWEKAYAVCQRLADDEVTIDFITGAGLLLLRNGRYSLLVMWIDALPVIVLKSFPVLLALQGAAAMYLGEVERGFSLLNQAEVHLHNDSQYLAYTNIWRAFAHCKQGKYKEALCDANHAIELTCNLDNQQSVYAEALEVKGESLYFLGCPDEALEYIENALNIFTAIDDLENIAYANVVLGFMMMESGRHKKAIRYFLTALDIYRTTNNLINQSKTLLNLGTSTLALGDLTGAQAHFCELLNITRQIGNEPIVAYALANIGIVYAELLLV